MSKVVFINGSAAPSLTNFRGDFIRALVARGHEVHATAPDIPDHIAGALVAMGCTPHAVPLRRKGLGLVSDIRYCRSLLKLFREAKAEMVVNYTIKPNIWGSLAARAAGIDCGSMVTGAGYVLAESRGWKERLVKAAARALYGFGMADNRVVIFQNPDDVRDFARAGMVTVERSRLVCGSGVNLARFSPAPLPSKPVFLMIARLLRSKGVGEYVAAARAVAQTLPDARFLLVGQEDRGPDGVDLREIEGWEESRVEFLGELQDVRPAIAQASVYVLPSYYREGTPRSTLEAMAMGRPIITTDSPGCRETVRAGRNGMLVPPRDAVALTEAMEMVGGDPALRARMGEASTIMAEELFAVDKVNAALIQHFDL